MLGSSRSKKKKIKEQNDKNNAQAEVTSQNCQLYEKNRLMKRRGAAGEAAEWFADEEHTEDCLVDRWGHDTFDK